MVTATEPTLVDTPSPADIRAEFDRMAVSDVFLSSPQLVSFLRFVVESTLRGKQDRIKGYTIGVEVLRRDVNFDPQIDPIVRVEATRLRRAIERYYAGPGADDKILIDIPLGGYVPTFRYRELKSNAAQPSAPRPDWLRHAIRNNPFVSVGALFVIAISLAGAFASVYFGLVPETVTTADDALRLMTEPLHPGNGMPTLAVRQLEIRGVPGPRAISAIALLTKLRDAFARFEAINVAAGTVPSGEPIDYELKGLIEYQGNGATNVQLSLVDRADGTVIWSPTFGPLAPAADPAASEDEVVTDAASALLDVFGVIRSHDRAKQLVNGSGDPRYRCLLLAADAFRSFDPAAFIRARGCLERLTAIDPTFSTGLVYLAILYGRQFQDDDSAKPSVLDLAQQALRRAIELNPANARAYEILGLILFDRHDNAGGFAALDRAISLNKYDLGIESQYGGRLIMVGEIDRGMAMLKQVAGPSDIRPSYDHFFLFLGNYLQGNIAEAAKQADEITGASNPRGLLARTLVAAAGGDRARATESFQRLVALQPGWQNNSREELDKIIAGPEVAARLTRDLAMAGFGNGAINHQ